MVDRLELLAEWIPEQMRPGDFYPLDPDKPEEIPLSEGISESDPNDPYLAVLACPECGMLGLITKKQADGIASVICSSESCPAEFTIREDCICPRKPQ